MKIEKNVPKRVWNSETLNLTLLLVRYKSLSEYLKPGLPSARGNKNKRIRGETRRKKHTRTNSIHIYKFIMQRMALSSISSVSQSQTRFLFSSSSSSSAKRHAKSSSNNIARRNVLVVRGAASSDENNNNTVELVAGIGGLVSCCVVGVSLFTLKNTGA
jgi:hypothetical protein